LEEECDAFGEIHVEALAQGFHALEERVRLVVEIADPEPDGAQFFLGFGDGAAGFEDGVFLQRGGIAEGGEFGGEEFLFGLVEFAAAAAELGFPVGALVVLEPLAGAADVVEGGVEGVVGAGAEDDEGGAEGFEDVE
jgi:hypothetical protein